MTPPPSLSDRLRQVDERLRAAARTAGRAPPRLLAVSKTRDAGEITALAALRRAAGDPLPGFGENYVQEAEAKIDALGGDLEWHLIGHLQSNKARQAAERFDWVQTLDRAKLVTALARCRDPARPLNVLIQVNVDDEAGKHGCHPDTVPVLAEAIAAEPALVLRGLMAIPTPHADPERRRPAFARMRGLFDALAAAHAGIDTLSMGMSDDLEQAVAEGATLVRVGTALFGARPPRG